MTLTNDLSRAEPRRASGRRLRGRAGLHNKDVAFHQNGPHKAWTRTISNSGVGIAFSAADTVQLRYIELFTDPRGQQARVFFDRALRVPGVAWAAIDVGEKLVEVKFESPLGPQDSRFIHLARSIADRIAASSATKELAFPAGFDQGTSERLQLQRYGHYLSTWISRSRIDGRIRVHNPALVRRRELCQAIEREFMNTFGIRRYSTNELTGTVLVHYNAEEIREHQVIELLDAVVATAGNVPISPVDLDLPIATTSVVLAATSRFLVPALTPLSAVVFLYSVIPSFKNAYDVLFKEKRLGVDVLDAIVVTACLATNQILAGTVLGWTLSVARRLVQKTEDNSKKMLLNVFGKQPRFVWLEVDGTEVETAIDRLKIGDVIAVHTGEAVPVDGEVVDGMVMIDQHTLTGESAPVEKIKGDQVFASTTVIGGKARIAVTRAGDQTTSAKIAQILNDTAGYKLKSQSRGEELADRAVAPTLALGALGLVTSGVGTATAIVNCDLGTGIRMAAPLAMLTSLTLSAEHGILVKDGRALEQLANVDTFLFDKTGTLTRERPEVGRVLAFGRHSEDRVLAWAAAAEHRFSHPIARAIIDKARALKLDVPSTDDSKYAVGYGITVEVEGHVVHVGSARYMTHENIRLPSQLQSHIKTAHDEGHTLVMVGVDGELGGAIELHAAERPEAQAVIKGLRARGARHLAIISGDHEQPTRKLAQRLGMDRYFAEVLPQDKARYVELLKKEGRTVCFIGDGVNDSIALKTANVSISLRGASTIATDTAQVVLMEDNLVKLLQLRDVSDELRSNITRSWGLIIVPNLICVAGAFFAGFGVMHSMVFNQIGGLLALGNGLLPLRKVLEIRAQRN